MPPVGRFAPSPTGPLHAGSLVAALALAESAATPGEVWRAVELDADWQAEQWGRDELSLGALESRRRDFNAGVRFLGLL
eukprot:gene31193-35209_t